MGRGSGAGLGLLVLLALFLSKRRNGVTAGPSGTFMFRSYGYRTRALASLAQEFEERLEEQEDEAQVFEKAWPGPVPRVPTKTRAIAYRTFLQEKPLKVTTGLYEIR